MEGVNPREGPVSSRLLNSIFKTKNYMLSGAFSCLRVLQTILCPKSVYISLYERKVGLILCLCIMYIICSSAKSGLSSYASIASSVPRTPKQMPH